MISIPRATDSSVHNAGLVRVLVVDDHAKTVEHIENALWVWPHRVTRINCIQDATKMCEHLQPTAIVASLALGENEDGRLIARLRQALPSVPIVALGTAEAVADPGAILEQGANAILCRDVLQQPTLHDLLMRLQEPAEIGPLSLTSDHVEIPFPWRDSTVFGSLICDIRGQIVCANDHLANLLGYSAAPDLEGLSVMRDILTSSDEWVAWKSVAGDTRKVIQQSTSIKTIDQQLLCMSVEAFALTNSPTKIQAVFVDLSDLTHRIPKGV